MRQVSVKRTGIALGPMVAMLLVASVALAQSGDGYDLSWSTVDGGGYTFSVGGAYELGGTVGQPDAGCTEGGTYRLCGGFWPGSGVEGDYYTYVPLVLKSY
ncbi:MAG TPA: hypothetical protein VMW58_00385 [Anaerolineae bacterium]|nr:hypothetical protein [Anaerolineae bacterium]